MPETLETPGPVCVRCFQPGADRHLANGWWLHDRCLMIWRCVAQDIGYPLEVVPDWLVNPERYPPFNPSKAPREGHGH